MMDVFTSPLDFELCNIIEVVVAEPLASTHTSFAFPPTTGTSEDLFLVTLFVGIWVNGGQVGYHIWVSVCWEYVEYLRQSHAKLGPAALLSQIGWGLHGER